jgi:hypothetical protein
MLFSVVFNSEEKYFIQDLVNFIYKRQHVITELTLINNVITVEVSSEGFLDSDTLLERIEKHFSCVESVMKL